MFPINVAALKFIADLIFRLRIVKINPRTGLDSPESDSAINDGKVASVGAPEWFVGCFGTQIADLTKRLAHGGFRPCHAAQLHSLSPSVHHRNDSDRLFVEK
jgi:hypothetical protein